MKDITKNEMKALLILFKDIDSDYNANNLSKKIGLTSMGVLKILKSLEQQTLLKSRQLGKAVFYKPNLNEYTKAYLKFLLQNEAEQSAPKVKKWIRELRKFGKYAEICILFGSVLKKEDFNDVDLLLVFKPSQNSKINRLTAEINRVSIKRIHLLKQTKNDFKENVKKKDKVLLDAIKTGVVLFGYETLIELIENAAS